jgi:hypothetical protein
VSHDCIAGQTSALRRDRSLAHLGSQVRTRKGARRKALIEVLLGLIWPGNQVTCVNLMCRELSFRKPSCLIGTNLAYFLELARHDPPGPAARQLKVEYRTLIRGISDLEKSLSVRLFARSRDGFVLRTGTGSSHCRAY